MKNGTISETGTYQELLKNDGAFAEFLRTYLEQDEDILNEDETEESRFFSFSCFKTNSIENLKIIIDLCLY